MLDENSPLSLYYQLKKIMIDNIKNKVWDLSSKIPTERELCEIYKVSRITVRQALKELEDEGYLYRKQGRGTFVTGPKFVQRLSDFYSFSDEIKKMGAVSDAIILSFDIIEAEQIIADKLGIATNEKAFAIKRLRLADNEPFAVETSYIVYQYAKELKEETVDQLGLYKALKENCGVNVSDAIETFEAVNVSSEDAVSLKVGKKAAALHLNRITYSEGRIIEYCNSVIRGDKYKYTIQLGKHQTSV